MRTLVGKVALVAGATRAAGRGIAVELGALGATVYVTGRSTAAGRSEMDRPETIEETAAAVSEAGGAGIAVRVDHSDPGQVAGLVARVGAEHGRLDLLVNNVWGGDMFTEWGKTVWEHDLGRGLRLLHQGVDTHLITSHHALPLLIRRTGGLVVEMTDGKGGDYRESIYYDLVKASVIRLAQAQDFELRPHGCAAVAVTPGWLRSERMLDKFGVTEDGWRAAVARDRHFAMSESPRYVGRGVAALAADPGAGRFGGQALTSADLAVTYDLTDLDGSRPDFPRYYDEVMKPG
ncbi:SDR family oxidoreductase [Paractinoplanes atraurantiacus]|uniref:NAD(P)-dependent dehydrogenase, short-chain alcohol dehydrogenase family n=1 Tax=Paractinoplanes atraurantiacus TaxID=1036182 RepID=A0A285JA23_9ACTN|nr:SDR family oxidoreductase [Actinoplanes atraurantiacus]SNY57104.1 NAD(P)-dependent dehydrogenase, short-chain alcohol dehydrogenase family [Actinoplanes atraurantiacus]